MDKKGFAFLLTPPFLFIILALLIVALLFLPQSPFKLQAFQTIDFAGFTWQGVGDITKDDKGFMVLTASRANSNGNTFTEMITDVTGIDELLVVGEGDGYASAYRASASATMSVQIRGSEGGSVGLGDSVDARSGGTEPAQTVSKHFDARIFKLKNNFDGTWSSLESLGVGDVFLVRNTQTILGTPILVLRADVSIGGFASGSSATGNIKAKFYNVVRKETGFAVCKADEFIQDVNQDGKITPDECFDLQTIVLNSEEAIKESTDEKLARIEAELLQKNQGLTEQIELLKQQRVDVSRIEALEQELEETKQRLADVEARDKNVIAVVEAEEQFEEPNFFKKILNKIMAWIKNLF